LTKLEVDLKATWSHKEEEELLDEALAKYGVEGMIDFDNFIAMMGTNPWKKMVPSAARDEVAMTGRRMRSESTPGKDRSPMSAPRGSTPTKGGPRTSFGTVGSPTRSGGADKGAASPQLHKIPAHVTPEVKDSAGIRSKLLELQAMMSRLKVVNVQLDSATISWPHNHHAKINPVYVLSMSKGEDDDLLPAAKIHPEQYMDPTNEYAPAKDGTITYTIPSLRPGRDYKVQVSALKSSWHTPVIIVSTKSDTGGRRLHEKLPHVHRSPGHPKSPAPAEPVKRSVRAYAEKPPSPKKTPMGKGKGKGL